MIICARTDNFLEKCKFSFISSKIELFIIKFECQNIRDRNDDLLNCQTPDLGQGLEFDFTFAM